MSPCRLCQADPIHRLSCASCGGRGFMDPENYLQFEFINAGLLERTYSIESQIEELLETTSEAGNRDCSDDDNYDSNSFDLGESLQG